MVRRKLIKGPKGQLLIVIPAYIRHELNLADIEEVDISLKDDEIRIRKL